MGIQVVIYDTETEKVGYVFGGKRSRFDVLWSGEKYSVEVSTSARYRPLSFGSPRFFSVCDPDALMRWLQEDANGLFLAQIQDDFHLRPKLEVLKSDDLQIELIDLGMPDEVVRTVFKNSLKSLLQHPQLELSSPKYLRFTKDPEVDFFRPDFYQEPWWTLDKNAETIANIHSGVNTRPVLGEELEDFLRSNQSINEENAEAFLQFGNSLIDKLNSAETLIQRSHLLEDFLNHLGGVSNSEISNALKVIVGQGEKFELSSQALSALREQIVFGAQSRSFLTNVAERLVFKFYLRETGLKCLEYSELVLTLDYANNSGVKPVEVGISVEALLSNLDNQDFTRMCVEFPQQSQSAMKNLSLGSYLAQALIAKAIAIDSQLVSDLPIWGGLRDIPCDAQSAQFLSFCLANRLLRKQILSEMNKWQKDANLTELAFLLGFQIWFEQADPRDLAATMKSQIYNLGSKGLEIGKILSNEEKLSEYLETIETQAKLCDSLSERNAHLDASVADLKHKIHLLESKLDAQLVGKNSAIQSQAANASFNTLTAFARVLATISSAPGKVEANLLKQVLAQGKAVGLDPISEIGRVVEFDPKYHDDFAETLSLGQDCEVISLGFSRSLDGEQQVFWKASVIEA